MPSDRRSAIFAIIGKEYMNRRKPPDVLHEILNRKKRGVATTKDYFTKGVQGNESLPKTAQADVQTPLHSLPQPSSQAELGNKMHTEPSVVLESSKQKKITAVKKPRSKKVKSGNIANAIASKQKSKKVKRNDNANDTANPKSKREKHSYDMDKKRKRSSRIEVKTFQSGSLLQLQPLTDQDKTAILKRSKKRKSSSISQLSVTKERASSSAVYNKSLTAQRAAPPKVHTVRISSHSMSPTTDPSSFADWQSRVICCGSCVGCSTQVNCDRCQQCVLRRYAPPSQQTLLRCMLRICSAPTILPASTQESRVVSTCKSTVQRPDPPVVANGESLSTTGWIESDERSPPGKFVEVFNENVRLDP